MGLELELELRTLHAGCTVPSAGCGHQIRMGPCPRRSPGCPPALGSWGKGPQRALGTPCPVPLPCVSGQWQLPRNCQGEAPWCCLRGTRGSPCCPDLSCISPGLLLVTPSPTSVQLCSGAKEQNREGTPGQQPRWCLPWGREWTGNGTRGGTQSPAGPTSGQGG